MASCLNVTKARCGSHDGNVTSVWEESPLEKAAVRTFPADFTLKTLRKTLLKSTLGTSSELESDCLRKLHYLSCFSWSWGRWRGGGRMKIYIMDRLTT